MLRSKLSVHRLWLNMDTEKHTHSHTHAHTQVQSHWEIALLVFKFDSDLTDLGHLALAAEQTAWLHLFACVCFHICACEHSCWRHFSEQADKLGGEGQIDAHHDRTAGNMQDAKDRPAFFVRCLPSYPANVSATSCTKYVACFFILISTSTHYLEVSTQKKKISHPPDISKGSMLIWESATLVQQKERDLIQGFGF